MKKELERRADILGFKCYYDISNGDMRSAGNEFMDWMFTFALLINMFYRKMMWRVFGAMVAIKMEIHPDEGEERRDMYLKMEKYLQRVDEEEAE
jgi:hypothetical protein